jgi:hypothetical protein
MKKIFLSLALIVLLIILLYFSYNFLYLRYKTNVEAEKIEAELEKYEKSPFLIEKEAIFNSASARNNTDNKKFDENNWLFTLLQYTDIAIYIKPVDKKLTSANTIKSLYIDNIKIDSSNKILSSNLYFLDAQNFGTDIYKDSDLIEEKLEYTVLNDKNKNNIIKTNTPVFFSDSSNPITLKVVNTIDNNFKLSTNEFYSFNSKILDKYIEQNEFDIKNIDYKISFDINITSNDNVNYSYPIQITNNYSSLDFDKGYNLEVKNNFTINKFIEK